MVEPRERGVVGFRAQQPSKLGLAPGLPSRQPWTDSLSVHRPRRRLSHPRSVDGQIGVRARFPV